MANEWAHLRALEEQILREQGRLATLEAGRQVDPRSEELVPQEIKHKLDKRHAEMVEDFRREVALMKQQAAAKRKELERRK